MAKARSPERDKVRRAWLESGGTMTAKQLAEEFSVRAEQVRKWKSLDNWQAEDVYKRQAYDRVAGVLAGCDIDRDILCFRLPRVRGCRR